MDYHVILLSLLAATALTLLISVFLLLPSRYQSRPIATLKIIVSAQILVLGDIGRSPRMQYHALSIAKHGGSVQIIGYNESALIPGLLQYPRVKIVALAPPPVLLRSKSLPFIISGPLKVIWQILNLAYVLGYKTKPSQWLLVQNPPSIPTLAISAVMCLLRNTRLIIDWHNYGWTILAGTRGASHPFVLVSKLYECVFGRIAPSANLTVTRAMMRQLKKKPYNITTPIFTMHDRPATIFQPITSSDKREEFLALLDETKDVASLITKGDMRLIVSSTSWTPDEDFSLLLDALVQYAAADTAQTPILAIITGRGPQKEMYLAKMKKLQADGKLPGITVKTAFLTFGDYAKLLACADLGICLHMSSSGVDLPMKVVDMFGAGLPVVAYCAYESFSELVKEGENGCGVESANELATALKRLMSPNAKDELAMLKKGAIEEGSRRWDEEWDAVVAPLLGFE